MREGIWRRRCGKIGNPNEFHIFEDQSRKNPMNYPAASSEVSPKDEIYFIVASDWVLNPQSCNKISTLHYLKKFETLSLGENVI